MNELSVFTGSARLGTVLNRHPLTVLGRRRIQYALNMGGIAAAIATCIVSIAVTIFPDLLYLWPHPSSDAFFTGIPWSILTGILIGICWGCGVWVYRLQQVTTPAEKNTLTLPGLIEVAFSGTTVNHPENYWAVFVDVSNVALGDNNIIDLTPGELDRAIEWVERTHDHLVYRQAYGDFSAAMYGSAELGLELRRHGFTLIHMPRIQRGSEKNHSDIQLTVDASTLARTRPDIGGFLIFAGDGDYTPLVLQLRALGKEITIVGREHTTSNLLASQASSFVSVESIIGRDMLGPNSLREAQVKLRRALAGLESQGIKTTTYSLPHLLKTLLIDVTALGFSDVNFFQRVMVELGVLRRTSSPSGDIINPGTVEPGQDALTKLLQALSAKVVELERTKQHPSLSYALEGIWKNNPHLNVTSFTPLVMLHILNIAERLNIVVVERRPNGEKRLIPGKPTQ
jgi:uncharacterized LabA/DUF88 family protein